MLIGPRQVGKTTLALHVFENFKGPKLFLSADDPHLHGAFDLNEKWNRFQKEVTDKQGLLIIDEIHKYPNWSEVVKARWDQNVREKHKLKVVLLGSAPLLIQKGLSDSLAGRFEIISVPHWSLTEVEDAFSVSLDEYIFYGGYPGAMEYIYDPERWKSYLKNSLIETTISRDLMLLTRIDKPALLRQLFYLSCEYSGQILSYQKMMGQMQDAGNTTTLAHYLNLLEAVGFVCGLKKFTGSKVLSRGSSPKLQVFNTGLMSALSGKSIEEVKHVPMEWGRWVESAVGAHLLNITMGSDCNVEYWKNGNFEVDFILRKNRKCIAIEVKSGAKKQSVSGLIEIKKHHAVQEAMVVGNHGDIGVEKFLRMGLADFL